MLWSWLLQVWWRHQEFFRIAVSVHFVQSNSLWRPEIQRRVNNQRKQDWSDHTGLLAGKIKIWAQQVGSRTAGLGNRLGFSNLTAGCKCVYTQECQLRGLSSRNGARSRILFNYESGLNLNSKKRLHDSWYSFGCRWLAGHLDLTNCALAQRPEPQPAG